MLTVRTGISDHLRTLDKDARECLKSYVPRVVVHKVSEKSTQTHTKCKIFFKKRLITDKM